MGRYAGTTWSGVLPERQAAFNVIFSSSDDFLDLCRSDGCLYGNHFHGLYRTEHCPGVLYLSRHLRCDEPVWLHHEKGPLQVWIVPDHGADRHYRRLAGEHFPEKFSAAFRHLGDWRSGVHRSHRKLAISGALRLYLDFINLFIMLLQLFGDRR